MSVGDIMQQTPPSAPAIGSNPFEQSSDLLDRAGGVYGGIAEGNPIADSMNAYLDPYYKEVISDVTGRALDRRDQDLMRVGDQAVAGGAFGGARHGLVESQVMSEYDRNINEMTNSMLSDRFNTAASLGQSDVMARLQAAGAMEGLGGNLYGIGQDLNDRQMASGNMQQQLLQQILGGASGQFDQYMNSPYQMIDLLNATLGSDPRNAERTQSSTPGLFDYLSLGAGMGSAWLMGG